MNILHNKKAGVKEMLGNKPSYSTMSLDIFLYVNHNIDIGLQYMDTEALIPWSSVPNNDDGFCGSCGGMMVCT